MTFGPRDVLGAVLGAYAQVVFSHREAVGAVLLVATMVRPTVGLWGLAGTLLATGIGLLIGLDRERLRRGSWGFNALLITVMILLVVAESGSVTVMPGIISGKFGRPMVRA